MTFAIRSDWTLEENIEEISTFYNDSDEDSIAHFLDGTFSEEKLKDNLQRNAKGRLIHFRLLKELMDDGHTYPADKNDPRHCCYNPERTLAFD